MMTSVTRQKIDYRQRIACMMKKRIADMDGAALAESALRYHGAYVEHLSLIEVKQLYYNLGGTPPEAHDGSQTTQQQR